MRRANVENGIKLHSPGAFCPISHPFFLPLAENCVHSLRSRRVSLQKCASPMPWGDWATAFPRQIIPPIILAFLFPICVQSEPITSSARGGGGAAVMGRRLHCLSCVRVEGDTTMLDQFRVRHGLSQPYCDMESVQCDVHQDTCVTITMQISQRQFWIGSGCDQRVNYDFPSGGREGCVEMPAVYRNFHPGFMEERRTLQRVCLCSANLCNSAQTAAVLFRLFILLTTLSLIIPCFLNG